MPPNDKFLISYDMKPTKSIGKVVIACEALILGTFVR